MKKVVLLLFVLICSYSGFAQNANELLTGYITVKNALVNDNARATSEAVSAFQKKVEAEPSFSRKKDLLYAIGEMAKANSIDQQRDAFDDVSRTLWTVIKKLSKTDHPVYYQYCPMKKAYWLSNEKEIKNPYYGSAMITCGKVVETKS